MKVLIAGAGAVGRSIARELVDNSYEVTLIERNPGHFDADEIPAADWIFGDACELRLLEVMHLEEFDVVIAATGDPTGKHHDLDHQTKEPNEGK